MAKITFSEEYLQILPKSWQRFFKKFAECETLPHSEWKPLHLVAHFAEAYHNHYGKNFSFSVKGAPSKCTEIYMIKRVMAMLGTTNQKIVAEYITWVFENKLKGTSKKIRSLGFLANNQFCNEFHLARTEAAKIKRSTTLPEDYLKIATNLDVPVMTFGDLAFAKQAIDMDPDNEEIECYRNLFHELYKIGFEFEMLKDLR